MVHRESLNTLEKDPALAKENNPHEQKDDPQYISMDSSDSSGSEMLVF